MMLRDGRSRLVRLWVHCIWATAMLSPAGPAAHADTTRWNSDSSGAFNDPANWDNGTPGADDEAAFIRPGASYTVTFPGSHPVTGGTHYTSDQLFVGANAVSFSRSFLATYRLSHPFTDDFERGVIIQGIPGNASVLNLGLSLNTESATIALAADSQGTLNVNGHNFNVNASDGQFDELIVGRHGAAALNVTGGGDVNLLGTFGTASLGYLPGASGAVTIDGPGSTLSAAAIYVGEGGAGALTIQNGGRVSTGDLIGSIGASSGSVGAVTIDGAGSIWEAANDIVVGDFGSAAATIQNGGTFSGGAFISSHGGSGTITVTGAGSQWTEAQFSVHATGAVNILNGGGVTSNAFATSTIHSSGSATVSGAGSYWSNASPTINGGVLTIENGALVDDGDVGSSSIYSGAATVTGADSQWHTGSFGVGAVGPSSLNVFDGGLVSSRDTRVSTLDGDAEVVVDGPGSSWTVDGELLLGGDGPGCLVVTDGGNVSVSGGLLTIDAFGAALGNGAISAAVFNRNEVRPGLDDALGGVVMAGALHINGTYLQSAEGELSIDLGGTAPGTEYDQLKINGSATLVGPLRVSLFNGFAPAAGDSFDVLDWTSLIGEFSTVTLPPLAAGLSWDASQLYTTGVISVVSTPSFTADFDNDGDVDGDDVAQWQGDFGANALSDADNDGDSDGADFLAWQRQLGSGKSAPPALAAPEPAASSLLACGLLLLRAAATSNRRRSARPLG